ncbi:MAG: Tic20 family protein [Cyanobacteria bacterium P01_G01_bin.54]
MQLRIFGGLPYLLPMIAVLPFGMGMFGQLKPFEILFQILTPVMIVQLTLYALIPFGPLVIFFALLLLVVRNPRIPFFIRIHVFQALLLDIFVVICGYALALLGLPQRIGLAAVQPGLGSGFSMLDILSGILFIFVFAAAIVGMIRAFREEYADLPIVTETARSMMR